MSWLLSPSSARRITPNERVNAFIRAPVLGLRVPTTLAFDPAPGMRCRQSKVSSIRDARTRRPGALRQCVDRPAKAYSPSRRSVRAVRPPRQTPSVPPGVLLAWAIALAATARGGPCTPAVESRSALAVRSLGKSAAVDWISGIPCARPRALPGHGERGDPGAGHERDREQPRGVTTILSSRGRGGRRVRAPRPYDQARPAGVVDPAPGTPAVVAQPPELVRAGGQLGNGDHRGPGGHRAGAADAR